jgi:hypothetical protein
MVARGEAEKSERDAGTRIEIKTRVDESSRDETVQS